MDTVATLVLRETAFSAKGDCIGVETGALAILKAGHVLTYAVGDFDSVKEEEKAHILKHALKSKVYPSHKDFSDSELAIEYCESLGYQTIYVYGALGQRVDHQQVNLSLMFSHPKLILMDETQSIQAYDLGFYELKKENYSKFSVFTLTQAVIDLEGCEYPLEKYAINSLSRLTLSNAWISHEAVLRVHSGRVFVVKTQ